MTYAPTIDKPKEGRDLYVYIPNGGKWVRPWIKETIGARCSITWNREMQRWIVKKSHLDAMREALLALFGTCYVRFVATQTDEICHYICQNAQGTDCECSCAGAYHGGALARAGRWIEIGDGVLLSKKEVQRTRLYTK